MKIAVLFSRCMDNMQNQRQRHDLEVEQTNLNILMLRHGPNWLGITVAFLWETCWEKWFWWRVRLNHGLSFMYGLGDLWGLFDTNTVTFGLHWLPQQARRNLPLMDRTRSSALLPSDFSSLNVNMPGGHSTAGANMRVVVMTVKCRISPPSTEGPSCTLCTSWHRTLLSSLDLSKIMSHGGDVNFFKNVNTPYYLLWRGDFMGHAGIFCRIRFRWNKKQRRFESSTAWGAFLSVMSFVSLWDISMHLIFQCAKV